MELKRINSIQDIEFSNNFVPSSHTEYSPDGILKKRHTNTTTTNNNNNNGASITKIESNLTDLITNEADMRAICKLACTMRNSYVNLLNKRKQDVFINSILISIFCISPISLLPFYYCLEAGKQIECENYEHVEFLLRRASYLNLTAFIIGSVIYIGLLSVALVLLLSFYQRLQSCSQG